MTISSYYVFSHNDISTTITVYGSICSHQSPKTEKQFVDLRGIIVRWAYNTFLKNRTWRQKRLKFKDLDFDVNWSKVIFVHAKPDYEKIAHDDNPDMPQSAMNVSVYLHHYN